MTWVRLDDGFVRHPRMVAAGLHGRALFIAGLCYCGAHLTDGRIPKAVLPVLTAEAGVRANTWKTLVEVGSWIDHGDVLEVHDYLVYNPSREKVLGEREAAAERQRRWRDKHATNSVTGASRNGVSSPSPSRPVPSPTESSSSHRSSRGQPASDDDLDKLWTLLAERRAEHEHPDGHGIGRRAPYLAKLITDHRDRLGDRARALRDEHPEWSIDDLAAELDPDTAPRIGNVPTVEQSAEWLEQQRVREHDAVPMPEHLTTRSARQ